MEIIGIILATTIWYLYTQNRYKKFKIFFTVLSLIATAFTSSLLAHFGLHDKWYIKLFGPALPVFVSLFISLFFFPYNINEIIRNEKNNIVDYYSTLNDHMKINDLDNLEISDLQVEKSIKLLKNILYAFSSSKKFTVDVGNMLFNQKGFDLIITRNNAEIGLLKLFIKNIITLGIEINDEKYLQRALEQYPNINQALFNLYIPFVSKYISERKKDNYVPY